MERISLAYFMAATVAREAPVKVQVEADDSTTESRFAVARMQVPNARHLLFNTRTLNATIAAITNKTMAIARAATCRFMADSVQSRPCLNRTIRG